MGRMRAPKAYDGPITVDVEVVTPELAAEWLTANTRNRNIQKPRVEKYADFMTKDQWRDGVADIAFDTDGVLQNGQHTLSAIVKANVPAVCTVKRGMRIDAQMITDTGRGRSLSDELQRHGFTNTNSIAAAVKVFPAWIGTGTFQLGPNNRAQRDAASGIANGANNDIELAAYCVANRDFLVRHCSVAYSRSKKTPFLTATNLMILSVVFEHFAGQYGAEFMTQLSNEGQECAQPIRKYQNGLLAQVTAQSKWTPSFRYAFAVKALNAFMDRTEIKHLGWKANEAFPTIKVPEGATV